MLRCWVHRTMGNRVSGGAQINLPASGDGSTSSAAEATSVVRHKPQKEKSRYGTVQITIASAPTAQTRRSSRAEEVVSHTVTSRGTIIHGSQSDPSTIQRGASSSERHFPQQENSVLPLPITQLPFPHPLSPHCSTGRLRAPSARTVRDSHL